MSNPASTLRRAASRQTPTISRMSLVDKTIGVVEPARGAGMALDDTAIHVTAGLYWLPTQRPAEPKAGFARLRDYLGWLVEHQPVYGIVLPRVFDIDRAQDIAAAELSGFDRERGNTRA